MIKFNFNVNEGESSRILTLHKDATKNYYIIKEQKTVLDTSETKKFVLPNNTFPSGDYKNFNKSEVDNVISQMNDYLKDFPLNQNIIIEIESSESKVPNSGIGLKSGDLSRNRGQELLNYLKGKLPQNVKFVRKDMGAQGPEWNPPTNATKEQIKTLANNQEYTKWQYVSFNITGVGQKERTICDLGFTIVIDYQKEWCKPGVDESKCHKCDEAVFLMWANGIPLKTTNGDTKINLNNNVGSGMSGPSRTVRIDISEEQKKEILSINPNEINITYGCALSNCHSDPAHITIFNSEGKILLPGTFITTGARLTGGQKPAQLIKLNNCSEVISIGYEKTEQPSVKEKLPTAFDLKLDESGDNYSAESLYQIYKFVGPNQIINIPEDQLKIFRKYKHFQGKPWQEFVKDMDIKNNNLKKLYEFVKTQNKSANN